MKKVSTIKSKHLILRCYANKSDGQWQAFCIDYCLAAQGDSFTEVKQKLENQINEYLYDALVGEDIEFADYLLSRKAPLKQRLIYFLLSLFNALGFNKKHSDNTKLFKESVPLVPHKYA